MDTPSIEVVAVAPLQCRMDYIHEVQRMNAAGMSERAIADTLNLSSTLVRELSREQVPLFGRRPANKNGRVLSATPHAAVSSAPIFEAE